jgi:hypothetical protein
MSLQLVNGAVDLVRERRLGSRKRSHNDFPLFAVPEETPKAGRIEERAEQVMKCSRAAHVDDVRRAGAWGQ